MRNTFVRTLVELGKADSNIMLLTGDLGFNALEPFEEALPDQYLNVGIAEQNMVGVSTGLALSGKTVFAYSIIPFVTFRCCEHIRDDIAYHSAPVCMVGVGSGYAYGILGSTHHSLEDIAVMRSFPNMQVICPGDPIEVDAAVRAIAESGKPTYLRLGKAGEPNIHEGPLANFQIGKSIQITDGSDVTIIATGSMLQTGKEAADVLESKGVSTRLLSMHTIKPIDREAIESAARETKLVVTLEEHSYIGGLGSAVSEVLCSIPSHAPQLTLACPDHFSSDVGSQKYLREKAGLTVEQVVDRVEKGLTCHASSEA